MTHFLPQSWPSFQAFYRDRYGADVGIVERHAESQDEEDPATYLRKRASEKAHAASGAAAEASRATLNPDSTMRHVASSSALQHATHAVEAHEAGDLAMAHTHHEHAAVAHSQAQMYHEQRGKIGKHQAAAEAHKTAMNLHDKAAQEYE
jgi:hypothetical protein